MTAGDTWVVPLDTAPVDASVLGGKGAALAELVALGHPVPSGFVITVPAYLAMLGLGGVSDTYAELSAAFRSGQTRLDLAERIASAIDASPYPPGLAEQIAEQIALLRLWDRSDGLIVRSSATVEDSRSSSFAGIFESVAIDDPASFEDAIRAVWRSRGIPMDPSVRRLAGILRRLSAVYPSERTETAAAQFLALDDPGAALGRALRYLVWQRTLAVALGHLEAAGADLGSITVPAGRVSGVFPRTQVWTISDAGPVSARRLIDVMAHHKELLAEPLAMPMTAGVGGFVVVSGRSFQVAYPAYTARIEFDTDLLTRDLPSGAAVASALHEAGYPVGSLRISRLGPAPHAAFSGSREIGEHHVSVGVLVGGYHGHRGPIVERARSVPWRGGTVHVPAAEDMLVMLAARVVRKRQFAFVNYNDAAVILAEEPSLDWDVVTRSARAGGLQSVLGVVLERAEEIVGRPAVPPHAWGDLDRTRTDRAAHVLTGAFSDPSVRLSAEDSRIAQTAVRMRRRLWTGPADVRLARAGVAPGRWKSARRRLELALYRRQLSRATDPGVSVSVVDRTARWLRPHCGSLCEVVPRLAGTGSCLALLGARPWRDATGDELRRLGAFLPAGNADHNCDRYRFELVG